MSLQVVSQLCEAYLCVYLCVSAKLYAYTKDTEGCVIPTESDAVCSHLKRCM